MRPMDQTEDARLVEAYRQGDDAAFGELLDRHLPAVYRFLAQLVGDRTVAEDLAQETFIKVWRHLGRYDSGRSFRVWVFAIAKNAAYDHLKKKKALPFSHFEDEEGNNFLEEIREESLLPDEALERQEIAEEMGRKLATLAEPYRALLLLRYREGFSLQEIATMGGEPYNTVKSRHQRALRALKETFV